MRVSIEHLEDSRNAAIETHRESSVEKHMIWNSASLAPHLCETNLDGP